MLTDELNVGDIVRIPRRIFCDFPTEHWDRHFAESTQLFVIRDYSSNNGNVLARDNHGRLYWFNTVTDDIELVKKS